MSRWQELGLTPDEAQDEINDLTRENAALRRERDEAVAEVARLRGALEQIIRTADCDCDCDFSGTKPEYWCPTRIARAALEGKP